MKANASINTEIRDGSTEAWKGCVTTVDDTDVIPCNKID